MDKPRSTWGFQANGDKSQVQLEILTQEEIDQIESRYLREVYQEARDKAEKEREP